MFQTLRIRMTRQSGPAPGVMSSKTADVPNRKQQAMHQEAPRSSSKTVLCSMDGSHELPSPPPPPPPAPAAEILIAGGGIVGLVLALAIEKYVHITPEIYEQAEGFEPDVGAGMGLYANGLRVLRDLDPQLLQEIQACGYPYLYRHFERHDGTSVVVADESVLGSTTSRSDDDDTSSADATSDSSSETTKKGGLQTMGIRRWKLQQALHEAVKKAGIPIHFGKKVQAVETPANGMTEVIFTDGSKRQTKLLLGADGGRSAVRSAMLLKETFSTKPYDDDNKMPTLDYTGVTCIMGVAENTNGRRGISFPISDTTKCHGAFYPTGESEQCFQFHIPVPAKKKCDKNDDAACQDSCWGNLSQQVSRDECGKLAEILQADGWDEDKFLTPLRGVTKAVRVGFCTLTPELKKWSFPNSQGQSRTILVGDAAHPPVPYIGQGSQQGMEDAATLALLLQEFCLDFQGKLDLTNIDHAVKIYESIRIPRVKEILGNAHFWGNMQQKRAQNPAYNVIKEE